MKPFLVSLTFAALTGLLGARNSSAQITAEEYQARRVKLAARLDSTAGGRDWVLLAAGAEEPEEDFLSFNQKPRFEYLTGLHEPTASLLVARRSGELRQILFVRPRDLSSNRFSEVWMGARLGPARVRQALGLEGRDNRALAATLDTLMGGDTTVFFVGELTSGDDGLTANDRLIRVLRRTRPRLRAVNANGAVDALRRFKSPAELDLIRKAVAITADAQRAAMLLVRPGINEFEVQALIEYTFRKNGADRPSFSTIVGSGPNSTSLHYNADDRFIRNGDVVVMDIGASYRGYAADVTRTVPANGIFSREQRDIYQAVRDAQAAGERQAVQGNDSRKMSDSATRSITASLARLGLIEAPDSTYDCTEAGTSSCPQYRLYYMHALGHPIGLEVHDTGVPGRQQATLTAGDAFTIEPGIYVRENLLQTIPDTPRNRRIKEHLRAAVSRYANIGVRIEDDYVVTDRGVEWISRAPREISEIEALMKSAPKILPGRDSAKVEWYRLTAPPGSRAP